MDWSVVYSTWLQILDGVPALLTCLVVLAAARFCFPSISKFRPQHDLIDTENPAVGVAHGGYLFGIALALLGAVATRSGASLWVMLAKLLTEGLLVIVLMQLALWTCDFVILRRFSIRKEICDDKNLGVGLCVAASCIACGLTLNGASTGLSINWSYGLLDTVIYWFAGQVTLVVGAFAYTSVARHDVHDLIEHDDNLAVGISFSGWLVCLGLVVRASLVHAGSAPLVAELVRTGLLACVGICGLLALQAVATRLLVAWVRHDDEVELHGNVALSAASACAMLATTLIFTSLIHR